MKMIERIARQTVNEFWSEEIDDEFVTMINVIVERIDSERAKEAVAWVAHGNSNGIVWNSERLALDDNQPLFLSPTIPEGMALVNEKLNPKQREIFASAFEYGKCVMFVDLWRDLLAAAQGERNAE